MKICVYTFGANSCCGGSTALYKLAKLLQDAGEDVRVWAEHGNYYGIPNVSNLADPFFENESPKFYDTVTSPVVAIYPEVVHGNPLRCLHVVRWMLNKVGVIGGDPRTWTKDDLVIAYAPRFAYTPSDEIVTAFETWPEHIYPSPQNAKRAGTCFAVHKGGHKTPKDGIPAAWRPVYSSPTIAGEMFRKHERFISYDSATWLNVQAALCGCLSIVVPDENRTANMWRHEGLFNLYGIAYGEAPAELEYARSTMEMVPKFLEMREQESRQQVWSLIQRLKERVGS